MDINHGDLFGERHPFGRVGRDIVELGESGYADPTDWPQTLANLLELRIRFAESRNAHSVRQKQLKLLV